MNKDKNTNVERNIECDCNIWVNYTSREDDSPLQNWRRQVKLMGKIALRDQMFLWVSRKAPVDSTEERLPRKCLLFLFLFSASRVKNPWVNSLQFHVPWSRTSKICASNPSFPQLLKKGTRQLLLQFWSVSSTSVFPISNQSFFLQANSAPVSTAFKISFKDNLSDERHLKE